MDSLTAIFSKAIHCGIIASYQGISAIQRLSIYADDVALFIKPTLQDLSFFHRVFKIFGEASGLHINFAKSNAVLIRGSNQDHVRVASLLHCNLGSLPCRYLGLQLAINHLSRVDWQPLLDQVRNVLPAWQ